jgi:hypothetical protein
MHSEVLGSSELGAGAGKPRALTWAGNAIRQSRSEQLRHVSPPKGKRADTRDRHDPSAVEGVSAGALG